MWLTSGYYGFPVFSLSPCVLCELDEALWLKRLESAGSLAVTDVHHSGTERTEGLAEASIILFELQPSEAKKWSSRSHARLITTQKKRKSASDSAAALLIYLNLGILHTG